MDAEWDAEMLSSGERETNEERVAALRELREFHHDLMAYKLEIRERPEAIGVRLEEMSERLRPDDIVTEALALLIESAQTRAKHAEDLDDRIDHLLDTIMVGSMAIIERLKPADGRRC